MEKQLICKAQLFMKLIVLPYGQHALQGQTVNFPVNASEVCDSLDNAGIVLIAPPSTCSSDSNGTPHAQTCFTICQPYVIQALHWLRNHNTLYRDIEIEEVSDDATTSQTAENELLLDEGESSVIRRDLQVPNIEVSNIINNNNHPVHQLQCVHGAPISLYTCIMLNRWPFHGYFRMALISIEHHKIHPLLHWIIFNHAT